jgi:diguanylate cyclase (GGDEF)-like protein/PAS domain S-box-containing protein
MDDPLPPRSAAPAPSRQPRLVASALAVAASLAYLLWLRLSGDAAPMRGRVVGALFIGLDALLVVLFARAARRSARLAPALRLLAGGAGVALLGRAVLLAMRLAGRPATGASAADLFLLASYPLTLAAFLSLPSASRREDRWKLPLDAGMVLAGAGVALWYFALRDVAATGTPPLEVALALIYPLGDVLLLVTLVTVLLRRPADAASRALAWLVASAALGVGDDLFRSLLLAQGGAFGVVWADALHLAASLALVVGAELFLVAARAPLAARAAARASRFVSALPVVAAGASYALLLVVALRDWVVPLSGLALGAIVVSLCLVARLFVAQRQHAAIVAERATLASEARFRSLVQHSSDLIFVVDERGVVGFASSSSSRLLGRAPETLVGATLASLAHAEDAARVDGFVAMAANLPGVSPPAEWRLRRPDGESVEVEAIATNLLHDATVRGIVVNARDVGERKALLEQLAHQAFHDPLTGLANRALFRDRVMHAISIARRQGRTVTVLYLDLDDFKQINDSLGHAEGDRLLALVASRLRACARSTDTVARLGGDEFAILVEDVDAAASAERLAERIREQMQFPFTLASGEVGITASIGSASTLTGSMDEVMRHADAAMYAAKRSGRGLHRAFDESMLEGRRW